MTGGSKQPPTLVPYLYSGRLGSGKGSSSSLPDPGPVLAADTSFFMSVSLQDVPINPKSEIYVRNL